MILSRDARAWQQYAVLIVDLEMPLSDVRRGITARYVHPLFHFVSSSPPRFLPPCCFFLFYLPCSCLGLRIAARIPLCGRCRSLPAGPGRAGMAQQGATLQNYNNELVKCIEDLREKREEASEGSTRVRLPDSVGNSGMRVATFALCWAFTGGLHSGFESSRYCRCSWHEQVCCQTSGRRRHVSRYLAWSV